MTFTFNSTQAVVMSHKLARNQGQSSVDSKDSADIQTDGHDRSHTFRANAAGNSECNVLLIAYVSKLKGLDNGEARELTF